MPIELPPFDPKNACIKCGNVIPDPVAPVAKPGPDGKPGPVLPPPPPTPPNVTYCSDPTCRLEEGEEPEDGFDEHMHAECTVCHYVWLTQTLDGGTETPGVPGGGST